MEAEDLASELQVGDVLAGKYRVDRVLGVGGMGIVGAAWHLELERTVAIKVLRSSDGDPSAAQRFAREARAASRLQGEHVVRIFDVGKLEDGRPYLVMEHLVGEDLEEALASGPLAFSEAVGHVLQACEAMAEAHAAGIIHRDLKPANLFVTRRVDGRPLLKVLDFGIAKRVDRKSLVELTGRRVAIGSPEYMSPEQSRGDANITAATDIWSLGVCLYELIAGASPFAAPSFAETYVRVLNDPVQPLSELRPEVPVALSAVVLKCLERDPAARFADVGELAAALEPFAAPSERGVAKRARLLLEQPVLVPVELAAEADPQREIITLDHEPAVRPRRRATAVGFLAVAGLVAGLGAWRTRDGLARTETPTPVASAPAPTESAAADAPPSATEAPSAVVVASATTRPSASPHAVHEKKRERASTAAGSARSSTLAVREVPDWSSSASAPSSPPPAPAPEPPRFVLASARVDVGSATNTFGTTAANVNRTVASYAARFTACYRDALPQIAGAVAGPGTLHLETDEDGVIIAARVDSAVAAPARCIAAAVSGKRVSNVDTGRARADVQLTFRAQ